MKKSYQDVDSKQVRYFYFQRPIPESAWLMINDAPSALNLGNFVKFANQYPFTHGGWVVACIIRSEDGKFAQVGFSYLSKKYPWDKEAKRICRKIAFNRTMGTDSITYKISSKITVIDTFNNLDRKLVPGFCKNFYITPYYANGYEFASLIPGICVE